MNFQTFAVVVLVAASFAYAAWTLMPQLLRAACAKQLLRLPLPTALRGLLIAASTASAGTDSEGAAPGFSPPKSQVGASRFSFSGAWAPERWSWARARGRSRRGAAWRF